MNDETIKEEIDQRAAEINIVNICQWTYIAVILATFLVLAGMQAAFPAATGIKDVMIANGLLLLGGAAVFGVLIHRNGLRKGLLEIVLHGSLDRKTKYPSYEKWKSSTFLTPVLGITAVVGLMCPIGGILFATVNPFSLNLTEWNWSALYMLSGSAALYDMLILLWAPWYSKRKQAAVS